MPRPSADCISYEVGMQGHRGGLRVHCIAFYAPTQALRRGVQEVWAVWTEGLPLVQSAMRGHALGAVSKLQ